MMANEAATSAVRRYGKVLVVDSISEDAVSQLKIDHEVKVELRPSRGRLRELVKDVDAIVLRSGVVLDSEIIDSAVALRVIGRAGVGIDNIDIDRVRSKGIILFNVPSMSGPSVAELALALLLSVARRLPQANQSLQEMRWCKDELLGLQLRGRRLGVLGLGSVGRNVAELGLAIGMVVSACVSRDTPSRREHSRRMGIEILTLESVLQQSDVLIVALPLTCATRGMIGREQLDLLPPDAIVIDVSRAGIVEEDALRSVLLTGRLWGAGVDVHEDESGKSVLAGLPNVTLSPHIGAMTRQAQRAVGDALVERLNAAFSGRDVAGRLC